MQKFSSSMIWRWAFDWITVWVINSVIVALALVLMKTVMAVKKQIIPLFLFRTFCMPHWTSMGTNISLLENT